MICTGGPQERKHKERPMTVAKVSEITSTSSKSFADAIERGIKRASKTLKNVTSAWIADQEVEIENGKVRGYRVRLRVTFVLED
jgi:dodecin